jgi:hypothetical protein
VQLLRADRPTSNRCDRRRAWRVLLGAIGVAIAIGAWAPSAGAASTNRSIRFVQVHALAAGGPHPLPVVDARIRVLSSRHRGSRRTIARGRTGFTGTAVAVADTKRGTSFRRARHLDQAHQARIPRHFTVQVSGGLIDGKRFRGKLLGKVQHHGKRPVTIEVNPATTLSVMYCRRHKALAMRVCRRSVARFLDLSGGTNLTTDLIGGQVLDGRQLLQSAGGAGGLGRYLKQLTREMGHPGSITTHPFHSPDRNLSYVKSPLPKMVGLTPNVQTDSGSWFETLYGYAQTANGVAKFVNSITSLVNFAGGGGDQAAQQLQQIDKTLIEVQSQIAQLQTEVSSIDAKVDKGDFQAAAAQAAGPVLAISNNQSSYLAVTNLAAQISCPPRAGGCTNPQSPAQVCENAATASVQADCMALGNLPLPGGQSAINYYLDPSHQGNDIGQFVWEMTQNNKWDDTSIQQIANALGGAHVAGGNIGGGMFDYGSNYLATDTGPNAGNPIAPLFGTDSDQQLQNLIGYYMAAYVAGTTMRGSYYGFNQVPKTTYQSPVQNSLDYYRKLVASAPVPLPAGTFIDTDAPIGTAGRMWSGQLGSVQDQNHYLNSGPGAAGHITLPYQASQPNNYANNAPGAQTPKLANGSTISNWSPAWAGSLNQLFTDAGHGGSYLVDNGLVDGQILSNGAWGGTSVSWPGGYQLATENNGDFEVTVIYMEPSDLPTCVPPPAHTSGCVAPTWALGDPLGAWDLNGGEAMANVLGKFFPINNWSQDLKCSFLYEPACNGGDLERAITPNWTLPVLYDRYYFPQSECYYYTQSGACG